MTSRLSFSERAEQCLKRDPATNQIKTYLLRLMAAKKTNLCLSADVTSTSILLRLADTCGPYICMLKTHADILDDFGPRTIKGLRELSRKHKFLIFEDRKFGDIGSTVQFQYTRGPLQIATWAHIVNAHAFPGPNIVKALRAAAEQVVDVEGRGVVSTEVWVGTPAESDEENEVAARPADEKVDSSTTEQKAHIINSRKDSIVANTTIFQTVEVSGSLPGSNTLSQSPDLSRRLESQRLDAEAIQSLGEPPLARALLLFAQMSSEGNLMDERYTQQNIAIAREHQDFVIGYIAQRSLNVEDSGEDLLSLTPGVQLPPEGHDGGKIKGDGLGQQYRTPDDVIVQGKCDIIIVGRGIIAAKDKAEEARKYRDAAWRAYETRLKA